jgi:hypothetical protein
MTAPVLHSTPRLPHVLREQVRVVGLALRWPGAVAGALLLLATLIITNELLGEGKPIDFHPEQFLLPGLVAALLPIAVWRGEDRFGPGFLWTLPVDRPRHALARVTAGWLWLMAAVAFFVLLVLVLAVLSGEQLLGQETLRLLPAAVSPAPGALDPSAFDGLPTIRWTPQPLLWLVPFTAATAAYLFASAIALGTRHPLRWIIGTALGLALLVTAGDVAQVGWLDALPDRLLRPLFLGPYGLDTVLSARTEFLKVGTTLTTGETVTVWRGLPDPGQWAAATLLWTCLGLAALLAAAARHRERRRS